MRARTQNSNTYPLTFFVTSTSDHVTGKTGLTLTITLAKSGSTSFAGSSGTVTEMGSGWYKLNGSSGDRDTLGDCSVHVTSTASDPADFLYQVVAPNPFDANLGLTNLDATITSRLASTGYTNAPTTAQIEDAVWDALTADHAVVGSMGVALIAAGGAADPLLNVVPGSYASGTAGAALGRIGSGEITIVSPVSADGETLNLVRGDDYNSADGRSLDFVDIAAQWPTLTSVYTIKATFRAGDTATSDSPYTMSVLTAGANQSVRLELASSQTSVLALGTPAYNFDIEAESTAGRKATLVLGTVHVTRDITTT